MFGSNTETGISVEYQDPDGTIDLAVGTLNQDTTGNADDQTLQLQHSQDSYRWDRRKLLSHICRCPMVVHQRCTKTDAVSSIIPVQTLSLSLILLHNQWCILTDKCCR